MKKILSSMLMLIAIVAFTACNSTGEVPSNTKTDDSSLAKTVASLVDLTVEEATASIEKAGFKFDEEENSQKFYEKEVDGNEIELSISYKDGKVVVANASGKVKDVAELKKFTINSSNYFYGIGTDLFAGTFFTDETTEENMVIYAEGDEFENTVKEALTALESMHKAGMIDDEEYEEAKKLLEGKYKSHADFVAAINGLNAASLNELEVQAAYAKFDEDKKNGHTYLLQSESDNGVAYFVIGAAYGPVNISGFGGDSPLSAPLKLLRK